MGQAFDLIVIGAGSGGVRAARVAADLGARVAIIEQGPLGGTCVNLGCIPKKLFVYGAHFADEFEDAAGFGWQVPERSFDWPVLRDNTAKEISRLNGIYQSLLEGAGVEICLGTARLLDRKRVVVGTRELVGERILIATGSRAYLPDWPGREHVITSDDAFSLPHLPQRALVVGGGYIAVEFAGILARLGVETTLLYRGPLFLRGFDDGVRAFVVRELARDGLRLYFEDTPRRIDKAGKGLRVETEGGKVLDTDLVLAATGRLPNTNGLGLENAGVELGGHGEIVVGQDFASSSARNIYAIGDVINRVQLTPVAIAEGAWLANRLFGGAPPAAPDYARIATAVFCQPPIGTIGMTEREAREAYGDAVEVYESEFRPLKYTLTKNAERTFMKLVVRTSDDRVVGVHMAGADAGEIIQGFAVALTAGATKAQFDATMAVHPTSAEEFVTMRAPQNSARRSQ